MQDHNIYRQKFNAYYGRKVSARSDGGEDFRVSVETLFPVFLCTAALAVAWTAVMVLAAFLFNLVADAAGGIDITLKE